MEERTEVKEYEINLLELARVLWEHIGIIAACTALAGLIALSVAVLYMPVKYESYTTLYVKNGRSDVVNEDGAVRLTDLNASKSLVTTYKTVLKSNTVMKETSKRLTAKYKREGKLDEYSRMLEPDKIAKVFSMEAVEDTEVLKIKARTTSPEFTADVCNTIADIAPDFLIRVVGAGSVEVIDAAEVE